MLLFSPLLHSRHTSLLAVLGTPQVHSHLGTLALATSGILFPQVLIPILHLGICSDVILSDILPFLSILPPCPLSPYFALFFFIALDSTWNYINTHRFLISPSKNLISARRVAFYLFIYLATLCGVWDPSPPPGMEPVPSAVEALEVRSLNHWSAREVPVRTVSCSTLYSQHLK